MDQTEILKKQVRVLIADDHKLVRTGIRLMLESLLSYDVVAETDGGIETLQAIKDHKPDLVILDMQMPNLGGMEVLSRLSREDNSPKVLVVSAMEPGKCVSEVFSKGAVGFLPKEVSRDEFELALKTIKEGKKYVGTEISEFLLHNSRSGVIDALSEREKEVFMLLAEGKKNSEIAKMLFVSPRTIDTHRLNIMKKLGFKTNGELAHFAMKHELI
jgi:DNA-binding NarL/FixJ family response regulator